MGKNQRIFLSSPHMSEEGFEMEYIQEAFDSNWIAPLGRNVTEFENEICNIVGCKAAVSLSSGTAALHMALKLIGVTKDDIVFCQSSTFAATANPIIYENAIPVFIDSDEKSWNISPVALKRAFIKYKKMGKLPKAVIVVHLYGIPADMDEIIDICDYYNVPIIEDAAESFGSTYKGELTGTFGKYAIFSFNGNKIITTSGGGMLLCNGENAENDAKRALFLSTQARENERFYHHKEIGYNYRMSNIVAGIGRGQLKVLQKRIEKKREIFFYYKKELSDIKEITMMPIREDVGESNCWLSCIIIDKNAKVNPIDIQIALEQENIEARPIWKPMHLQPVFLKYDYIDNGKTAEKLFERGICLPSDTKMGEEELSRIIKIIKGLWN